jgi:hypothetical protein
LDRADGLSGICLDQKEGRGYYNLVLWTDRKDSAVNPSEGERLMRFLRVFLVVVSSLFFASTVTAGTLYSWKDDKGMTHLSNQAPPKDAKDVKEFIFSQHEEENSAAMKTGHEGEEKESEEPAKGASPGAMGI